MKGKAALYKEAVFNTFVGVHGEISLNGLQSATKDNIIAEIMKHNKGRAVGDIII